MATNPIKIMTRGQYLIVALKNIIIH